MLRPRRADGRRPIFVAIATAILGVALVCYLAAVAGLTIRQRDLVPGDHNSIVGSEDNRWEPYVAARVGPSSERSAPPG